MWIKILNPFLVIFWSKVHHIQVFWWLASTDSKTDLQFHPSEISKRDSWKHKLR